MSDHESTTISYSSEKSLMVREEIFDHLTAYPGTKGERERSLGLFLRGSLLARIIAIEEIYRQIVDLPGCIFDVGTWRGQTAVLCENFRAIFEPLHLNRRIICFDTFDGYAGFGEKDKPTALHDNGTYGVGGQNYRSLLQELLTLHEKCNAMGEVNFGKHSVIAGDCMETIPAFFNEFPNEFVALAFFDVNAYEPTKHSFEVIWEKLVPGGIAAFWQLTRSTIPAEGRVFAEEILTRYSFKIKRCATYPGLCYLIK